MLVQREPVFSIIAKTTQNRRSDSRVAITSARKLRIGFREPRVQLRSTSVRWTAHTCVRGSGRPDCLVNGPFTEQHCQSEAGFCNFAVGILRFQPSFFSRAGVLVLKVFHYRRRSEGNCTHGRCRFHPLKNIFASYRFLVVTRRRDVEIEKPVVNIDKRPENLT